VHLTATLAGGGTQPSTVTLRLPDGRTQTLTTSVAGAALDAAFVVAPGGGTLQLHTDGPAAPNAADNIRDQHLRVINPLVREDTLSAARLARLGAP
jgi:hypothetical protein